MLGVQRSDSSHNQRYYLYPPWNDEKSWRVATPSVPKTLKDLFAVRLKDSCEEHEENSRRHAWMTNTWHPSFRYEDCRCPLCFSCKRNQGVHQIYFIICDDNSMTHAWKSLKHLHQEQAPAVDACCCTCNFMGMQNRKISLKILLYFSSYTVEPPYTVG